MFPGKAAIETGRLLKLEGFVALAEREGQQTRAQQDEARSGQGEEAVTDMIVVAHDEPHVHDAGPN